MYLSCSVSFMFFIFFSILFLFFISIFFLYLFSVIDKLDARPHKAQSPGPGPIRPLGKPDLACCTTTVEWEKEEGVAGGRGRNDRWTDIICGKDTY